MTEMKITRVHVRELRALGALDLPEDGLGWSGIPDVVVVGGANGSGKTTLLNLLASAIRGLRDGAIFDLPSEGLVDVSVSGAGDFRWVGGKPEFVQPLAGNRPTVGYATRSHGVERALAFEAAVGAGPRLILLQSPRDLLIPSTSAKTGGVIAKSNEFFHSLRRPSSWLESAEALFYEARWLDLNAKEEGRPEDATNFARYADAFSSLLPGRSLIWQSGALAVEVAGSGARHGLEELSSGEKQIVVLLAELLVYWAPGSILLVDEPELHLHASLQVRFFDTLVRWRAERGGQLWVATQSNEIFRHAPEGSAVLLGAGSLV